MGMPMARRFLPLSAVLLSVLGCRPESESAQGVLSSAPPQAPVVATLSESGVTLPDPRTGSEVKPAARIVGRSPTRAGTTQTPIAVTLSSPVDTDRSDIVFALEPEASGRVSWTSPTRAVFRPDGPLRSAHRYDVAVHGLVATLGGGTEPVKAQWSFETPRPTVSLQADTARYGSGRTPTLVDADAGFTLRLSGAVARDALRDALVVTQDGAPAAFELRALERDASAGHSWRLEPVRPWPADATVEARVAPGLVTAEGPLPTSEETVETLRVRPGVLSWVECEGSPGSGCMVGTFRVEFDAPLPMAAAKKIRLSPRPDHLEVHRRIRRRSGRRSFDSVSFDAAFEPGRTYTLAFEEGIRSLEGLPLVGPDERTVTFVGPDPELSLEGQGTQLSMHGPTLGVEARYVERATLTISTLSNAALAEVVATPTKTRSLPKHGVTSRVVSLDLTPEGAWGWNAQTLSLSTLLGSATGAAFVDLRPTARAAGKAGVRQGRGLFQVTNLGVVLGTSPTGGFARVLTLDTAEPVEGATAQVFDTSTSPPTVEQRFGPSDADGIIRFATPLPADDVAVVVETDDDRVAIGIDDGGRGGDGREYDVGVMMTDRPLYHPGERVRVMGWVAGSSPGHPTGLKGSKPRSVEITLYDHRGAPLDDATVRTKPYGKFWATLDLPEAMSLGDVEVRAVLGGGRSRVLSRDISVREFRAPSYDVTLALENVDLAHGETAHLRAVARYLHGMPVPLAEVSQQHECMAARFDPVGPPGFRVARPAGHARRLDEPLVALERTSAHDAGRASFDVKTDTLSVGHPYRCRFTLHTTDAARQVLSTQASAWVHPSHYLLVSTPTSRPTVGEQQTVRLRTVLPSGEPVEGTRAVVRVVQGGRRHASREAGRCTVVLDERGQGVCRWTPRRPGRHTVAVTTTIDGVKTSHEDVVSVVRRSPRRSAHDVEVALPEAASVGQSIDVVVTSPRPKASATVVEVQAGIREVHPVDVEAHRGRVALDVSDAWVPRGYVDTVVVSPSSKDRLPGVDVAHDDVRIGWDSRALGVSVRSPSAASPGDDIPIDLEVTDPAGEPVADAHVSVWAVDEGVLVLRGWSFPDLAAKLAPGRGNEANYAEGYRDLVGPYVARDDPFEPRRWDSGPRYGRGAGAGFGGKGKRLPRIRQASARGDFQPSPIFIGDVKTGPDGTARVRGVLPDNLTSFRIAAVATAEVAGTGAFVRAGRGEGRVRVTQEFAARLLLPRVLRPGDHTQLGVLVDNLGGHAGNLDVAVELKGGRGTAHLGGGAKVSKRLEGAQVRIPVSLHADEAGEFRVRVSARLVTDRGRVLQDSSVRPLEVRRERGVVREVATHGSMLDTRAAAVALSVPPARAGTVEAHVDVYASLLRGYEGSARTLVEYPYGCLEQTSSRLLPLVALDGLADFDLGAGDVTAFIRTGLRRLATMQTSSGGLAYWPGADHPHPYATAYAAWILSELERVGHPVEGALGERLARYLKDELRALRLRPRPSISEDVLATMFLLALASHDHDDPEAAEGLVARLDRLPTFAKAALVLALHRRDPDDPRLVVALDALRARVRIRDGVAATKAERLHFGDYFDSPVRTDAMTLLAFVRASPDDPLVEPLARGLTRVRDRGQLRNTQENAYALLAMAGYTEVREAAEPNLDLRAWVGSEVVVDAGFRGRDLGTQHGWRRVEGEAATVVVQREGQGRGYYRVGMRWMPDTVVPEAHGIAITRALHDSRGPLKARSMVAGESGTLEVDLTTAARNRYVVVDIPLPAGLEPIDRSLGRGGGSKRTRGGHGTLPYSHQELRDDRVLLFIDKLPAGTYHYRVPVRATHEGSYSMPPAHARAMYNPEVSGNTGGRTVEIVEPRRYGGVQPPKQ